MIASFSPPGEGSAVLFLWHHRFRRGHRWTVKMPSAAPPVVSQKNASRSRRVHTAPNTLSIDEPASLAAKTVVAVFLMQTDSRVTESPLPLPCPNR